MILFTQPCKKRNLIFVDLIIHKITRLENRIVYFHGFFKATRYPWFSKEHVCQQLPIVYCKSKKKQYIYIKLIVKVSLACESIR